MQLGQPQPTLPLLGLRTHPPPRKSPFPGKTFPGTALSPNVTPTPSLQCCQPLDHLVVVVAVNAALVVTASSRPAPSSPMHGGSRCPGRTQGRGRDRIPDTIRRRQCSRVRILFYFLQNPKNGLFTFSWVAAHVFSNNGRRRDISWQRRSRKRLSEKVTCQETSVHLAVVDSMKNALFSCKG